MSNRADNFTRVTPGNLDGSTPSDGGSAWSVLSGTWNTSDVVGQAKCSIGTQAIAVLETSSAVGDAQVTIPNAINDSGLVLRCTDDSNYWVMLWTATQVYIFKKSTAGGGFTSVVGPASISTSINSVFRFTVSAANVFQGYLGGSPIAGLTCTDSFNSTATKTGIRVGGSNNDFFDDFSYTDNAVAPGLPVGLIYQRNQSVNRASTY